MSRKKKKMRGKVENEKVKEQGNDEVAWPQFPYTFEEIAKAVVTPIKSEERKKRFGIE